MGCTSFAVNLTNHPLDETTMTWESHSVRIISAHAVLESSLDGESPAWIHIAGGGLVWSFLFQPPCGVGSRRVAHTLDQQPIFLEARQALKVWGIRPGAGGVFRVEIEWKRARMRRGADCPVARVGPEPGRFPVRAGDW